MKNKKKKKNKGKNKISLKNKVGKGVEILRSKISTEKKNNLIKKVSDFKIKLKSKKQKDNLISKKENKLKSKKTVWIDLKMAFFLAWKSIQRGNKSSLILVIGIMMIVFLNLLFTDSIFAGITKGMNDNKVNYQYGEIIIEPEPGKNFIEETRTILDRYKGDERILELQSNLKSGVVFVNEKDKDGRDSETIAGIVMAWDKKGDSNVFDFKSKMVAGRYFNDDDFGKIILGSNLSGGYGDSVFPNSLEIKIGDKVKVNFSERNNRYFEVIGIYKTKNFDIDRRALLKRSDVKKTLGLSSESSEIIFRLKHRKDSKRLMKELKVKYPELKIEDWEEKISFGASIGKSFETIGMILKIIGSLVAGLVIFIIIFVNIVNNRKQIGILKAIGIKQNIIIFSYIFMSIFYILMGIILGYVLMEYGIIELFVKHPIQMPMADVIPFLSDKSFVSAVWLFSMFGLIGSSFPAFFQIRKKILDLLYH